MNQDTTNGNQQQQQPAGQQPQPPCPPQPPPKKRCPDLKAPPKTPELPKPKDCPVTCICPATPSSDGNCISTLIEEQAKLLAQAERTKTFKADLEDLLKKTKAAKDEYTATKRKELVEDWQTADADIVDLMKKLVCSVPCWQCLIECRICWRLNDIRRQELRLNGDGTLTTQVYSLYDLQYWQTRNRDARREVFDRIRAVFTAWEKPATAIAKILTDNATLADTIRKNIGTDSATAVYDAFMTLIPRHLAIKPPEINSKIANEYIQLCECYVGMPDNCCGPNVGELSVRERLIGPLPYLIKAEELDDMFCCLVLERYLPAKDALGTAEAALAATEAEIKRLKTEIEDRKKSLPADFKAGLTMPINCDDYKPKPKPTPTPGPTPPQYTQPTST